MPQELVFIGMGGTIAGVAATSGDNIGYAAGALDLASLLGRVDGLAEVLGDHALVAEQVAQINSKDITLAHWRRLVTRVTAQLERAAVTGVVVTHGTDTLEETAYFLHRMIAPALLAVKPVVLTCAMRPATARSPDGPQNLRDATALALDDRARGVLVVCAARVHAALHVQKVQPYRLDAFDSGDAGPVAVVEEGQVRWFHGPLAAPAMPSVPELLLREDGDWPRVEIVVSHAGAGAELVRSLCAAAAPGVRQLRGIVVAGTGNGSIHADMEAALQEAQAQGVKVVRTTRCARGMVVEGKTPAGGGFRAMHLSPVKARIALMLDLATGA
jgi:L-asparaginase